MITKNRSRNVKRKRKTQEGVSPFYPLFNNITFSQTQTGTTALADVAYVTKNILTGQFPSKMKKKNLRYLSCIPGDRSLERTSWPGAAICNAKLKLLDQLLSDAL
jgi:hypothetical protein